MPPNWDPEVRKFFVKILNTVSYGLIWMILMMTLGLYFGLAYHLPGRPMALTIGFYVVLLISLGFLIRYFYKRWK